jgi:hypothetical protein
MNMTICISAMAKDNKGNEILVFSTDHMVSTPVGQFDHKIKKYKKIGKSIVMLSGRSLLFDECIKDIKPTSSFSEIKNRIFENMKQIRNEAIKNEIYNKFILLFITKSIHGYFPSSVLLTSISPQRLPSFKTTF